MSSLNQKLERALIKYLIAYAGTVLDGSSADGSGVRLLANEDGELVVNENNSITTAIQTGLGNRFDLNWYVGETTETVTLPAVIAVSENAQATLDGSFNYECQCYVELRLWGHNWSGQPDVVSALEEISNAISAALDDLDTREGCVELALMEYDFHCLGMVSLAGERTVSGNVRAHRYSMMLRCCENDLTTA